MSTGEPTATLDADYAALLSAPSCGARAASGAAPEEQVALIVDLDAYFVALEALGTAKDETTFDKAATNLSASIASFAKGVGASAPEQAAPGIFSKLAQATLQDAEYQAMRKYVVDMDPLLAQNAPAVTSALRLQQAYYMTVVASDASESAGILNKLYRDPVVTKDRSTTLAFYAASVPIVAGFEGEQTSVRTDPATAVKALVTAHHALYAALQTDKEQFPAIVSSVTDLAASAGALITPSSTAAKPVAPPAAPAPKKGE
ncbi:hypothetical protein [Paraburkholderia guartelaensis]|uniref:hypothetical protein n=1 Tax=Paraburkholderia guartelaensis TaxID=2546446 RepID=UPI002AB64B1A|nr:hypothetical protein [Paraburkholderia guartelaensis]